MKGRGLWAWFLWCALAGFGVVLPLAISQDPGHEALVRVLRALGGAGLVLGLVMLIRSFGPSAPDPANEPEAEPDVPRTLCGNPLAALHGRMPLAERIDMAAEASSHYRRSVGVICFHVESHACIARAHGEEAADAAMEFIIGILRLLLRGTDRIERIASDRFVICLALLPDRDILLSVRERATRAMSNMRIETLSGAPIRHDSGVALSSADGNGVQMIAEAQQRCEAARLRRCAEEARSVNDLAQAGHAAA